jgi:hypothetical protein
MIALKTMRADVTDAERPPHLASGLDGAPWRGSSSSEFHALSAALVLTLAVGACALTPGDTSLAAPTTAAPAAFERERLIGRWGVASFHNDKDRRRTEAEARAQCGQPYAITKGPTDGVMMHVADDPKRYELRLKGTSAGQTYLGFEAPPGDPQDREILSSTDRIMTMRFVDPEVHRRYGTFVYVRCGA